MLDSIYFDMPSIIFNQKLDEEDVKKLTNIFKNWLSDELAKREIKKGKLFEFDITLVPDMASIRFGNKNKYMEIMQGLSGNPFEDAKQLKIYSSMIENMKQIAEDFINENDLTLEIKPSGGLAIYYIVSR